MIDPTSVEHNLMNLRLVSERLAGIPHFLFFGSLLGFVREGSVIKGDDDIDIYVDRRYKDEAISAFAQDDLKFKNRPRFKTRFFAQASRTLNDEQTFIDFYFYKDRRSVDYIVENWNFSGEFKEDSNALHIPKSIIFPLQKGQMTDFEVSVPADPEACCTYLYGPDWRVPKAKNSEYRMEVIDHRPQMVHV